MIRLARERFAQLLAALDCKALDVFEQEPRPVVARAERPAEIAIKDTTKGGFDIHPGSVTP